MPSSVVFFLFALSSCLVIPFPPTAADSSKGSVDVIAKAQTILTVVSPMTVDKYTFPPSATLPEATGPLFLGGAGVRGLEIDGKFIKFTAIAVYLGNNSIESLSGKWKGKTGQELMHQDKFFLDIISGPFVKLTQVRMILPLTGKEYAEKVIHNCITYWKSMGRYTDAEARAVEQFHEVFKDEKLPPGASIFFEQSECGTKLKIGFSKDGTVAEKWQTVENKQLTEAVLESIIGRGGVSPEARRSLAERLSKLMTTYHNT